MPTPSEFGKTPSSPTTSILRPTAFTPRCWSRLRNRRATNAFGLLGAQLPGFDQLEGFFTSSGAWSEQTIGVPYDQLVTQLNTGFNPFTAFIDIEGPTGADPQNLLDITGIQQDLLDPVLRLVGTLGGMFTS